MPVYTYQCQNCGVRFEKTQKFDDKPLTRCPECRRGTVRRVMQPAAIVFKGSGWYATDSKSASGANRRGTKPDSDGGEKTASDKADKTDKGDKSETKPAKKEASAASDD